MNGGLKPVPGFVFENILDIIQLLLFFIGCYYLVISFFSLTVTHRERMSDIKHTFAVVVAAHNEENVIAQLVESLKKLNYPEDKYDIFVVADNCTDRTAEFAASAGAEVLERCDLSKRGKGFALEYAFNRLFAMPKKYEYICVFDADNIVGADFLIHMNNKINEGCRAVQGYLDSKNPCDSWLTFSYSLWYWINNRIAQLSRGNLNLGCRLGGTGFAVETELIKKYGWGATCLAEDTEFTLKLALNDIKVGWCHEAVVYDEKPLRLDTSINQRKRWVQGIADVASRYIKPLAQKGFYEKKAFPFHMIMNFWSDSLYSFTCIFFAAVYLLTLFGDKTAPLYTLLCGMWIEPRNMLMLTAFIWGNVFIVFAGLYNDGKLDSNIIKNSLGFIVYIITWIPIGIMGILKKNDKEWFHTPHSPKDN